MSNKQKFLKCNHCGNLAGVIHDSGVPMVCCGQPMEELIPNTLDASHEKHVPVLEVNGNIVRVTIGTVPHPMTEEHLISWAYIATNIGGQRKSLAPNSEPTVKFALVDNEKVEVVYAYCNMHGLWMGKV